jgi:hypothetical protein
MNLRQQQAMALLDAHVSIIPVRPDGTKAASIAWEGYQHRYASRDEVMRWFASLHSGIAIIGGHISEDLEILDFDDAEVFPAWRNLTEQSYEGLIDGLPVVQTPTGGYHVYYRAYGVEGNQKLARSWHHEKPGHAKVETRGEGGYVLSPFCHPDCHVLKRPYQLIQGDLCRIPLISQQARLLMLENSRAFDEYVEPPKPQQPRHRSPVEGERPGDVWASTHTWHDILEPHGWKAVSQSGDLTRWKRPGKDDQGWSATTGHKGHDVLYVFSENAYPFEANRGYSKFTALALLNYHGDFSAAAKAVMKG